MNNIPYALLMTLLAGAATGLGGILIIFKKKLSSNFLSAALGLSAGVMIFISLAELLPEAQHTITHSYPGTGGQTAVLISFFIGMGLIFLIDFLVPEYENPHEASGLSLSGLNHNENRSCTVHNNKALKKLGLMSALAIAIHNFPEGMATFIGAMNNPQIGTSISLAVAIHNIPEGIAVAIPIFYATGSRNKAIIYATLSGLTEPIGAGLCYALTSLAGISISSNGSAFPLILAAVAGIMIYISIDELLPTAEKYGKHHVAIAGVVTGMAVMGISLIML